ncbi:hypothetical protein [Megamonas sp.]|uniref:hypothetical protein n=1 Tax=Megamonas sp. TaxID=2049033 RepID=UPI002590C0D8|nr:hypothetical protein [Megamonas sp.]
MALKIGTEVEIKELGTRYDGFTGIIDGHNDPGSMYFYSVYLNELKESRNFKFSELIVKEDRNIFKWQILWRNINERSVNESNIIAINEQSALEEFFEQFDKEYPIQDIDIFSVRR